MSGEVLPMQLIYKGKQIDPLPTVGFPAGFVLTYNKEHWRNEKETLTLTQNILCPYIKDVKKKVGTQCFTKHLAFVGYI